MTNKEYTSGELVQLLREKYGTDHLANGNHPTVLLEQVANGTGFDAGRWIDAVVFEMWPSKGFIRRAFELKVSRTDFLRELNNPVKFQWCFKHFHQFWYVAPKDVIQVEELPQGAGWLYPSSGGKLITGRIASHNTNPELNDELLASFMRSADKEKEKFARSDKAQYLQNDSGYKRAKTFENATRKFLERRNPQYFYVPETEDDITKALEDATMDKEVKSDKELLMSVADRFQDQLAELFNTFAVIASKGVLAKDEAGKAILDRWGNQEPLDKESLKKLRDRRETKLVDNITFF
jgi:hypothetical protein